MNTYEIQEYYPGLLIIQYNQKPKAQGTIRTFTAPLLLPQTSVQTLSFSPAPDSGTFNISWNGETCGTPINWNDSASTIQTAWRTITGLSSILVIGSIADGLVVTFTGVPPVAVPIEVESNSLLSGSDAVEITIAETDETLPLAVQNGYNVTGDNPAAGTQLDVIGKYVGVRRTAPGFYTQITLDDADYRSLIRMAVIKNSAQSDLYTIQNFIFTFFPGQILVTDFRNMRMSYLISYAVGSQELVQMFITQKLLPVPLAVQLAVIIYAPVITDFFGFCDYAQPAGPFPNQSPYNDWDDYQSDWPWLAYENGIFPP